MKTCIIDGSIFHDLWDASGILTEQIKGGKLDLYIFTAKGGRHFIGVSHKFFKGVKTQPIILFEYFFKRSFTVRQQNIFRLPSYEKLW